MSPLLVAKPKKATKSKVRDTKNSSKTNRVGKKNEVHEATKFAIPAIVMKPTEFVKPKEVHETTKFVILAIVTKNQRSS